MFKAEVQVFGDSKWYSNALTFNTEEQAAFYAQDLSGRWTQVVAWGVSPIEEVSNEAN